MKFLSGFNLVGVTFEVLVPFGLLSLVSWNLNWSTQNFVSLWFWMGMALFGTV